MQNSIHLLVGLLCFSLATAQITFTREWVAGKRSAPPSEYGNPEKQSQCISLRPVIDFLLHVESMQRGLSRGDNAVLEAKKIQEAITPVVFRKLKADRDKYLEPEDDNTGHDI